MNDTTTRFRPANGYLTTILTLGAFWGFAEATLGFALHTLPRILPVPNLAGAVMFPIALIFMVQAIEATRRPSAALAVAAVAAAIKASSLALPMVRFAFVRSPVLAILAEGAIVTAAAAAGLVPFSRIAERIGSTRRTGTRVGPAEPLGFDLRTLRILLAVAASALVISVAWRGAFLGLNAVLGITGGIMSKPPAVLLGFVTVDSLWNAGVIAVVVAGGAVGRLTRRSSGNASGGSERLGPRDSRPAWRAVFGTAWLNPVGAAVALLLAVAFEWGLAAIPM